ATRPQAGTARIAADHPHGADRGDPGSGGDGRRGRGDSRIDAAQRPDPTPDRGGAGRLAGRPIAPHHAPVIPRPKPCIRWVRCAAALLLAAAKAPDPLALPPVLGAESWEYTHEKDTLLDVAARSSVGIIPLMALNPDVDVWIPPANTRVRLPTD